MEKPRSRCNLLIGFYVTGKREMLLSKSRQVPIGVTSVTLRKTGARASCLLRRDFLSSPRYFVFFSKDGNFEEEIISQRKISSLLFSAIHSFSLSSSVLGCWESYYNFPNPNMYMTPSKILFESKGQCNNTSSVPLITNHNYVGCKSISTRIIERSIKSTYTILEDVFFGAL